MKVRFVLVGVAVLAVAGCGSSTPTVSAADASSSKAAAMASIKAAIEQELGTTTDEPAPVAAGQVTYSVSGNFATWGAASITMQAPTGTVQKEITSPGDVGSYPFDPDSFVYLSVQNESEFGAVTCTITVDGQVVSTNTSQGAYVIASCKGKA